MKTEVKAFMIGVAFVGLATWANAAPTLIISNDANPVITVVSSSGVVETNTSVGVWDVVAVVGLTTPTLGSSSDPEMELTIQASSTAADSLTLIFSDDSFALSSGTLTASISGHVVSGAGETVTYGVFGNTNNIVGSTIMEITGIGPTVLPVSATAANGFAITLPYSLTQVVDISTSGPSVTSIDASFEALVPEPSTIALVALGLMGALGMRRKM